MCQHVRILEEWHVALEDPVVVDRDDHEVVADHGRRVAARVVAPRVAADLDGVDRRQLDGKLEDGNVAGSDVVVARGRNHHG